MKLKNIKTDFNQREIEPSAASWEKLSAQLDAEQKKSKKPYVYWIGAVAAILLIALMVFPLVNDTMTEHMEKGSQIVITDPAVEEESGVVETSSDRSTEIEIVSSTDINIEEHEDIDQIKTNSKEINTKPKARSQKPSYVAVKPAVNTEQTQTINEINPPTALKTDAVVQNDIAKLTPEEEANLLLNGLLNDTSLKKNDATLSSIKPEQLLRETEWDVEISRRNRLNDHLKDGLGKLKTEAFAIIGVNN